MSRLWDDVATLIIRYRNFDIMSRHSSVDVTTLI